MSLAVTWYNDSRSVMVHTGGGGEIDWLLGRITVYPKDQITYHGSTEMKADQWLESLLGYYYIWAGWFIETASGPYWFAIKLVFSVQVVHAGYAPHYEVAASRGIPAGNDIKWRIPVTDPAMGYTFGADDLVPASLKIRSEPVAGGQSLSLSVTISDIA